MFTFLTVIHFPQVWHYMYTGSNNEDDSVSFVAMDFSSKHDTVAFILNEGKLEELTLWLFEDVKK